MSRAPKADRESSRDRYDAEVAAYVSAGGSESVQRVVTAVNALARRLSQWYTDQLTDVGLSAGEWGVIAHLAIAPAGQSVTPSQLANALSVAPSSMTHRLDRMTERELVTRTPDEENRTRVLVALTEEGWQVFRRVIRGSDVMESNVLDRLSRDQQAQLASLLELAIAGLDDAMAERAEPAQAG
ncbi:DNA-binding MarR family transcriptional regulator [Barrientosiimonas humi]|jgi:DNA-binding MarR family transcriptional regulator|uniref:DNA-binding MarR family transcriptional regulator n=2 Tax=Barrientosiimonas TaxID=1535207 RepID=A0A542X9Z3_9MICO|nr:MULTISPECIES: MarR family transcriptional regulator [Barrientosiimonas]TQL32641.1 DNA-binding MarR family transcriptional regulator [Barrientosiimonas humi]BDZ57426.1 transcriptional regulator [Barrientosiimonas endolithica]CAG7572632.1 Transcriptional regulator SlyA [Barrientosiimonas humi]